MTKSLRVGAIEIHIDAGRERNPLHLFECAFSVDNPLYRDIEYGEMYSTNRIYAYVGLCTVHLRVCVAYSRDSQLSLREETP